MQRPLGTCRAPLPRISSLLLLAAGLCACTAIADLDRFEPAADAGRTDRPGRDAGKEPPPDSGADSGTPMSDAGSDDAGADAGMPAVELGCENPRTLCVQLKSFGAHVTELVQVDLITDAGSNLRARARLDPFSRTGVKDGAFVMPLAIGPDDVPDAGEKSALQLAIFADDNGDGVYTVGEDHDWYVDLPPNGKLTFLHNSSFVTIDPPPRGLGGDFRMQLRGMGDYVGMLLELMVIEKASGRTVGLFRTHALPSSELLVEIADVIDPSLTEGYTIELFADVDGDYAYDPPPTDDAWVAAAIPTDDGVMLDFEPTSTKTALAYQHPFSDGN